MAAASPFGPDPTTIASGASARIRASRDTAARPVTAMDREVGSDHASPRVRTQRRGCVAVQTADRIAALWRIFFAFRHWRFRSTRVCSSSPRPRHRIGRPGGAASPARRRSPACARRGHRHLASGRWPRQDLDLDHRRRAVAEELNASTTRTCGPGRHERERLPVRVDDHHPGREGLVARTDRFRTATSPGAMPVMGP
jgi:hypothetical protein